MSFMFFCFDVENLDLSSFNTSNVMNMHYMFYGCQANFIKVSNAEIIKEIKEEMCDCDIVEKDNLDEAKEALDTLKMLGATSTSIIILVK